GVQLVIKTSGEIVAVCVLTLSRRAVQSVVRLFPTETGRVQSITYSPIIRQWHPRQILRTDPDWVDPFSIGIIYISEQVERIQEQGITVRVCRQGLAGESHGRRGRGRCAAVLAPRAAVSGRISYRQISENPLTRGFG